MATNVREHVAERCSKEQERLVTGERQAMYATHIRRQTRSSAELLQLNQGSLSLGYKKCRDIPGPNSFFRTLQGLAFSALTRLVG